METENNQTDIPVVKTDIEIPTVHQPKEDSSDIMPVNVAMSPVMAILDLAMKRGDAIEKITAIMDLQERQEENDAKKAYYRAMAAFKANAPDIIKTEKVDYKHKEGSGRTSYMYADLGDIAATIGAALSEHGLFADWSTETTEDGRISVTCTITHELGHSNSVTFPPSASDTSGKKNPIQAIQSSITYQQRYTLLAATGLAAKGMDDDGRGGDEVEYISQGQALTIQSLIDEIGDSMDNDSFLAYLDAESIEHIPAEFYKKAVEALNERRAGKR